MRRVALLLAAVVLLAGAAPSAATGSLEDEVVAATGITRTVSADLQARAAVRAAQIQTAGAFDHCCLTYGEGEVLAWNTTGSLAWMVSGWLASPDHAAILLNLDYHRIGCAVDELIVAVPGVTGSAGWYGVCILSALAAPAPAPDAGFDTIPNTAMGPADFCQRHASNPNCATPTPTPSGEPMPTGDLPGWALVFNDDFTQPVPLGSFPSAVADRWASYPYPWTTLNGYYYPEKVVSWYGSVMDLWLHNEGGEWLMAASTARINGPAPATTGQLYGRYALRFRVDALPGYYGVPLLWPTSEVWPRDGEIDFPEGNLDATIHAFMHHQDATSGSDQDAYSTGVAYAPDWHIAVTEWSPAAVRFILDGVLIGTSVDRIPNTPMRWVLQFTTSPSGLPQAGTSGHVLIDWVAVWRYAP